MERQACALLFGGGTLSSRARSFDSIRRGRADGPFRCPGSGDHTGQRLWAASAPAGLVDAWSGGIESPALSRDGDRDPGSLAHVGERRSCKAEVHGFESLAIHQNRGVELVGGASYTSPTTLWPAEYRPVLPVRSSVVERHPEEMGSACSIQAAPAGAP